MTAMLFRLSFPSNRQMIQLRVNARGFAVGLTAACFSGCGTGSDDGVSFSCPLKADATGWSDVAVSNPGSFVPVSFVEGGEQEVGKEFPAVIAPETNSSAADRIVWNFEFEGLAQISAVCPLDATRVAVMALPPHLRSCKAVLQNVSPARAVVDCS